MPVKKYHGLLIYFYICLIAVSGLFPLQNLSATEILPTITIIIDDIGYRKQADLRALALPGPVAYAILPHAPHTGTMATIANQRGKEILLHQPMQALKLEKNEYLGPGALTLNMTRDEFMRTLDVNIKSVPHLIGLNNHMGSLLTRHPGYMQWLMESIKSHGQIYIDSLTSNESVASAIAKENDIPYLTRDVFLDNEQNKAYVHGQFMKLVKVAKRKGSAIAIGHPYQSTIDVLAEILPDVKKYGVKLVSIHSLMHLRGLDRKTWAKY